MATTTDMAPARRNANTGGTRSRSTTGAAETPREQQLEDQVAQLQRDLKSITETLGKLTGEKVDEAKQIASTELKQLKKRGQDLIEDAQGQAVEVEQQLKDTIREKPLTAVATAMGIGFVLALLTRH